MTFICRPNTYEGPRLLNEHGQLVPTVEVLKSVLRKLPISLVKELCHRDYTCILFDSFDKSEDVEGAEELSNEDYAALTLAGDLVKEPAKEILIERVRSSILRGATKS